MAGLTVAEKATVGLKRSLNDALASGGYSDLKIRVGDGKEWNCHRVILCQQCEFFANAIKPGFKESITGVIDMDQDPPEAVEALLGFLYTIEYAVKTADTEDIVRENFKLHVDVYILATKYFVGILGELSSERASALLEQEWETLLPTLCDIAKHLEDHSPAIGCTMRRIFQEATVKNVASLLESEALFDLMREVPQFMKRVMEKIRCTGPCAHKFACPSCKATIIMGVPAEDKRVWCKHCRKHHMSSKLRLSFQAA